MSLVKLIVDCLTIDQRNSIVYCTYEFVGGIMNNSVSHFSIHEHIFELCGYSV